MIDVLYWIVSGNITYRSERSLAGNGTLGPVMNIFEDQHIRHKDQLLLQVL